MSIERYPDCPESLTQDQLADYWENGFVVFDNVLSEEEVETARADLRSILESALSGDDVELVRPVARGENHNYGGVIYRSTKRGGALDNHMFTQLEPGFDPGGKSFEEIDSHVRKYAWFEDSSSIFHSLYTNHPRVTGVVRSILGSDIDLYQSMALVKPPKGGSEKPWHQDNAYFSTSDLDRVAGVWIALDEATAENGCMHFIRGGHRAGPLKHHHTTDCKILPDRIDPEAAVPVEIRPGSAIFFHGNIPHFTPKNNSEKRRRALQYHFRARQNAVISREDYFRVFAEADGTPASCAAATQDRI